MPELDKLAHNTREHRILRLLRQTKSSEILYHHRFPTSTENVRNACHPFSTKATFGKNYVMVHNGVVHNPKDLHESHVARGIEYVSTQADGRYNDSEALLYDIALYLEGEQDELKANGSIAFIVVENDENGPAKLRFGRNTGSPLHMRLDEHGINLASEAGKFDNAVMVAPNKLFTFDYATNVLTEEELNIPQWEKYESYNWNGKGASSLYDDDYGWDPHGYNGVSSAHGYVDNGRRSMGFDTRPVFEDGENLEEQTYWDSSTGKYVPESEIQYASNPYWAMMADRGEALAFDLLAETGSVDQALKQSQKRLTDNEMELRGLTAQVMRYREGSKRANKINKKRQELWVMGDLMRDCSLSLQSMKEDDMQILDDATIANYYDSVRPSTHTTEAQQMAEDINRVADRFTEQETVESFLGRNTISTLGED